MSSKSQADTRVAGHAVAPAIAIGALSVVLAVGLDLLGFLDRANADIAARVSLGGTGNFPKNLPDWAIWAATVGFAIALAVAILSTPGGVRRIVLWLATLVVLAGWAPVLSLAAHAPEIAAPWIACAWSGFCSMVYAANHLMPCDEISTSP
ncbi:MAG: hypothetical protein H8M99_00665 [Gloeobacteraceae cyanobacterium ES-bin-144]|nr:hypothetical protein [Verrucomicrobiales bacterium]